MYKSLACNQSTIIYQSFTNHLPIIYQLYPHISDSKTLEKPRLWFQSPSEPIIHPVFPDSRGVAALVSTVRPGTDGADFSINH